jgi:hypothetical protein
MKDSDGDRADRKRTIVGGRPKAKDKAGSEVPRGVAIVLKMAAMDAMFAQRLIHMRGQAAKDIGVELTFAEAMVLEAAPEEQLQAMIDAMPVSDEERQTLKAVAPRWTARYDASQLASMGIRPEVNPDYPGLYQTRGIRPDWPDDIPPRKRSKGIRPDDD